MKRQMFLTQNNIAIQRLFSQQIAATHFKTVNEIVRWMGAIQAQDYPMAKWAIGLRLPGSTDKSVEMAFNKGEIIRTHVLRPTWHFVSAEDISWMLELTASRIKSSLKTRQKQLGLTASVLSKSNNILEKALVDRNFLTRNDLKIKFEKAKIPMDGNRLSHLMMHAELESLVCSGPVNGKQQTYALFEERIVKKEKFIREEALAKLAKRYFKSHCPVTIQDFVWWSGLAAGDAREALELVKSEFVSEKIEEQIYWLSPSASIPKEKESVYFLPAYDEFIISYKDRSATITFKNFSKSISHNGVFRPILIVNGKAIGIWKRTVKKGKVIVETNFFEKPQKETLRRIEKAAEAFGKYLDKEIVLI